ncbi:hypothetical protein NWT09_22765 [Mycolicibacterium sp. jd]|jgi:uncharacterized protein (DUF1778 family)|uniref:hypothetical protein n=1 Tax=unclassified Mycolicibacterium TaxID=2636767 RepID=UPI00298D3813|nr:hypothetical protein [Mycolicibacterium sp. D5.8-2]MDW5610545.1 hypothetical protein [Mycolicibacterium sp. D5.8-2]
MSGSPLDGARHTNRTKFVVQSTAGEPKSAREMVATSAALALDRVRAFIDVVDHPEQPRAL